MPPDEFLHPNSDLSDREKTAWITRFTRFFKDVMQKFVEQGILIFNGDRYLLSPKFNKSFTNISELIPIDNENFIILKDKSLYVINRVNNKFVWRLIPEKYYEGKIINQDTKVFKVNGQYLLNLDDGFFAFKLQKEKPYFGEQNSKML